jgi:hypothetical protein
MLSNAAKLNCAGPSRFRKLEQGGKAETGGRSWLQPTELLVSARRGTGKARDASPSERVKSANLKSDLLDSAAVPSLATCGQRVHFRTVIPFPSVERPHASLHRMVLLSRTGPLKASQARRRPNMPASLHPSGSARDGSRWLEMARDGSRWLEMACGSAHSRERQSTKGACCLRMAQNEWVSSVFLFATLDSVARASQQ